MSIAKLMEDEAHLLFQELQQHVINQVSKGNKINPKIQEILGHLENHLNPTPVATVEPTVVVEAPAQAPVEEPQTVAQEQSAANVAN